MGFGVGVFGGGDGGECGWGGLLGLGVGLVLVSLSGIVVIAIIISSSIPSLYLLAILPTNTISHLRLHYNLFRIHILPTILGTSLCRKVLYRQL